MTIRDFSHLLRPVHVPQPEGTPDDAGWYYERQRREAQVLMERLEQAEAGGAPADVIDQLGRMLGRARYTGD